MGLPAITAAVHRGVAMEFVKMEIVFQWLTRKKEVSLGYKIVTNPQKLQPTLYYLTGALVYETHQTEETKQTKLPNQT